MVALSLGESSLTSGESPAVLFVSRTKPEKITIALHCHTHEKADSNNNNPHRTRTVLHLYGAILLGIMNFIGIIWE